MSEFSHHNNHPIESTHQFQEPVTNSGDKSVSAHDRGSKVDTYLTEHAKRAKEMIASFIKKNGLDAKIKTLKDTKILWIEKKGLAPVDQAKIEAYAAQQIVAERGRITNNCFDIAAKAYWAGIATGRLATHEGATAFVGWGNHCINFDELSDGTVVAFDLTASSNIDCYQGDFSLFALRDRSIDDLLLRLNDLYGGQWNVIQID